MKILTGLLTFSTTLFAAPYLWVSDFDSNVYVVDTGTNPPVVVQTISGLPEPVGIAFTPDGNYAYVVNYSSPSVSVFKTSDYSLLTTITLTGAREPYFITMTPDGDFAYVANYSSSTVSVISTKTTPPSLFATFPSSFPFDGPYPIAASPNGNYVYVGNYSASPETITVINTQGNTFNTIFGDPSFYEMYWIAFAPNGTAYVANAGNSDQVSVIDTSFHVSTITSPNIYYPYYIAITPNGNAAYVQNDQIPYISVINLSSGNTVTPVADPNSDLGFSYSLAISPDGAYVYAFDDGTLNVVSTADNTVIGSFPSVLPTYPYWSAFQPSSSSPRSFKRPNNRR